MWRMVGQATTLRSCDRTRHARVQSRVWGGDLEHAFCRLHHSTTSPLESTNSSGKAITIIKETRKEALNRLGVVQRSAWRMADSETR